MEIENIEIGATLEKENWIAARDNLAQVFPIIANWLLKINGDGRGKEDAEEFMAHAQLAYQAMTYVAEFAADKCRFIVIPEDYKP